ncbi:hypothetical protein QP671_27505, partial [Klebsiella pneumoniae]|nr:hypothetical protein [Klebsiella pneumoniae]
FLAINHIRGLHILENTSTAGTTVLAICSDRCIAILFGTSSEITIEKYDIISVKTIVVSGPATCFETPQDSTNGTT